MAKKKKNNGLNPDEIEANIAAKKKELQDLSTRVGTESFTKKDNKRFNQLNNEVGELNKQLRSQTQNVADVTPDRSKEPFVEKRTEVVASETPLNQGTDVDPIRSRPITPLTSPQAGADIGVPQQVDAGVGGQPAGQGDIQTLPPTSIPSLEQDPNLLNAGGIPGQINTPTGTQQQQDIVSKTLEGVQRGEEQGVGDAITKSIFGGGGVIDPNQLKQGKDKPFVSSLDITDVSSGINDPILKGTVSGQIIGNQPIFVGDVGYRPTHLLARRQKEIQDAANKKAEEEQDFLKAIAPPKVEDQRFQGSLNDQFNFTKEAYFKKAQEQFGDDWVSALKDQTNPLGREFVQALDNFEHLAGETDQVTAMMAEIEKDLASGDRVYSDRTLDVRDDYNQLANDFANGDVAGAASLRDKYDELRGFTSLDKILHDKGIQIKGQITEITNLINTDELLGTSTQKQVRYEEQVRKLAEHLAQTDMRDAVRKGYMTVDDIFEAMNARYGSQDFSKKTIKQKREDKSGITNMDDISFNEGDKKEKVRGRGVNTRGTFEFPSGGNKAKSSGVKVIDPVTGDSQILEGVVEYSVSNIGLKKVKNKNTGKVEEGQYVTAVMTVPGGGPFGGEDTEQTVIIELDDGVKTSLKSGVIDEETMEEIDRVHGGMMNVGKTGVENALDAIPD